MKEWEGRPERRENRCKQKIINFIGEVIKVNNSEVIVKEGHTPYQYKILKKQSFA